MYGNSTGGVGPPSDLMYNHLEGRGEALTALRKLREISCKNDEDDPMDD